MFGKPVQRLKSGSCRPQSTIGSVTPRGVVRPSLFTVPLKTTPPTPASGRKLRSLLLPMLLLVGCCWSDTAPNRLTGPPRAAGKAAVSDLRVATYNIYFRTRDLAQINAVLKNADADVVALQEVTPDCAPLLDKECCGNYPYRYFSGGLGLLSRYPLRNTRSEKSRKGINGFIFAEVEHPRGRVQIANLHLDPLRLWSARDLAMLPLQFRQQRSIQRAELIQAFAHLKPGMPTIVTGDFNRVGNDAVNKLRGMGFTDSLAAVTNNPDSLSTLHFSLLGLRLGRRIDYIFHDNNFQTAHSKVLPGKPSDHDVLVSGLAWSSRGAP